MSPKLDEDSLQDTRKALDEWLADIMSIPEVVSSQFLYQFLCSEANIRPIHLEVLFPTDVPKSWSMDELEMDMMFRSASSASDTPPVGISASYSYAGGHERDLNTLTNGGTGKVDMLFDKEESKSERVSLESFTIIKSVGKGSFGHVFLSRFKPTGKLFALKVLNKDYIKAEMQVEHTMSERAVLTKVNHPNIVSLVMAFQTRQKLFFVLDYCAGGELFYQLSKTGRFTEDRAKFYAAQIILALEHIHSFGFIYRYPILHPSSPSRSTVV